MQITNKVLKRWVHDYALPIRIFTEPHFSYALELYEPLLHTQTKFGALVQCLLQYNTQDAFLEDYYSIRNQVIEHLKNNPDWQTFNTMDMAQYKVPSLNISSKDVFKHINHDCFFVSVDLVKGNFQSLRYVNPQIVDGTSHYNDFLRQFTDNPYMLDSKYLRQVIFGSINPKRQVQVERFITYKVLSHFLTKGYITLDQVMMFAADEFIFKIERDQLADMQKIMVDVVQEVSPFAEVDVEVYQLKSLCDGSFFAKEFKNKKGYELMCVPQKKFAQAYKYYNHLPIQELDLYFLDELDLVKYAAPSYEQ